LGWCWLTAKRKAEDSTCPMNTLKANDTRPFFTRLAITVDLFVSAVLHWILNRNRCLAVESGVGCACWCQTAAIADDDEWWVLAVVSLKIPLNFTGYDTVDLWLVTVAVLTSEGNYERLRRCRCQIVGSCRSSIVRDILQIQGVMACQPRSVLVKIQLPDSLEHVTTVWFHLFEWAGTIRQPQFQLDGGFCQRISSFIFNCAHWNDLWFDFDLNLIWLWFEFDLTLIWPGDCRSLVMMMIW